MNQVALSPASVLPALTTIAGNANLRAELTRLTNPPDSAGLEWLDVQIQQMEELRDQLPHSVRLRTRFTPTLYEVNCFMLALDIEPDAVRDMCADDIFPGKEFMQFLLEGSHLQRVTELGTPAAGSVVVYLHDNVPKHAGIWTSDRVTSKWGACATHIWEHALWEVPDTYGHEAQFFTPVPEATEIYLKWAADHGL